MNKLGFLVLAMVMVMGCSRPSEPTTEAPVASQLTGAVLIDGSSTVYPITEAVAEEFQKLYPQVRVTVGIAGTGGGFKRFLAGETDINDASRPVLTEEVETAVKNGLQFVELPIAYDGLSILVNSKNDFVSTLSVAELKKMWEPGSKVKRWSDVRPTWPAREIHFFGAGTDSGTFDYFTEAINGKAKAIRGDFSASEDDNVLVQGIAGDVDAIGFFGFAYYAANRDKLKLVAVDNGAGPILPSPETIRDGSYAPLSRPVFIYVAAKAEARPEVKAFVDFYLAQGGPLATEVGYIQLPDTIGGLVKQRWASKVAGSVFHGHAKEGQLNLEALLQTSK
ncbi:MAG: PstS family phosphate ABC transporter substrate-binding protein [Acidobacteria bacterium]|nr:PstS family phosphate ABC transporter substrate-binding protein [Acidobacteriota bacterium]